MRWEAPKRYFARMIAVADKTCSSCGEQVIGEGELFFADKTGAPWCVPCKDYDDEHPVDDRKRF